MNSVKVIIPRNETVIIDKDGKPLFVDPLSEGEQLVDVGRFNDFVKPLYDEATGDFIESATPEEIEAARPTPPAPIVSDDQKAIDMMKYLMQSDAFLTAVGIPPKPAETEVI